MLKKLFCLLNNKISQTKNIKKKSDNPHFLVFFNKKCHFNEYLGYW